MTKEEYWVKNKTKLQLNERSYNSFEMGVKFCENKIADIKANCDYILEGKEIEYREERKRLCDDFENMKAGLESKIAELEQQIQDIIGMLNDILWKCTCEEYEKATQELKELINKWEIKENDRRRIL